MLWEVGKQNADKDEAEVRILASWPDVQVISKEGMQLVAHIDSDKFR